LFLIFRSFIWVLYIPWAAVRLYTTVGPQARAKDRVMHSGVINGPSTYQAKFIFGILGPRISTPRTEDVAVCNVVLGRGFDLLSRLVVLEVSSKFNMPAFPTLPLPCESRWKTEVPWATPQ
jgi:hypothetical protein